MNTVSKALSQVIAAGMVWCALSATASAKVDASQAAKLGRELTPVGAEKAANKDGRIPEWTGGTPQSGAPSGEYPHDEKIDGDKPLFTISKANMAQYADQLTAGHRELLSRFDSYRMNVYPSHRTVAFPDFIYKATAANAVNCNLKGTEAPDNCRQGFLYPIPQSGAEVIWNHKQRFRGTSLRRFNNQFIVQPDGSFQPTKIVEEVEFLYANDKDPVEYKAGSTGTWAMYRSRTTAPPRTAGTLILLLESTASADRSRQAWLYSPALKRTRRAPTVQFDNPYEGTDGSQFYDQVDMFNGSMERYTWKLAGKKEMLIPYNSNRIAGNKIKFKDMIVPRHLNQDLPRYELHRVWVVEADLKSGVTHVFKKRRFYVDEDSWTIAAVDAYDNHDELYKFQEGHVVTFSNVLAAFTVPEVIYDFNSGRYFLTACFNEDKPYDYTATFPPDYFTAESVQKSATK